MNLKKLERYLRVNLLAPGHRIIEKEFTGPRSHSVCERLIQSTLLCQFSWMQLDVSSLSLHHAQYQRMFTKYLRYDVYLFVPNCQRHSSYVRHNAILHCKTNLHVIERLLTSTLESTVVLFTFRPENVACSHFATNFRILKTIPYRWTTAQ